MLLDNDGFLSELTKFFEISKNGKSLFLTMKRYDGRTKPRPRSESKRSRKHGDANIHSSSSTSSTNQSAAASGSSVAASGAAATANESSSCLIRATLGNKKISTIVQQKEMNRFQQAYAVVLKANIDGLKKRDKKGAATSALKSSLKSNKA